MSYHLDETICAIASPPHGALRGIVRLSGPDVVDCLQRCFSTEAGQGEVDELRRMRQATVVSGRLSAGALVGQLSCQLYYWPDRRSYTRQSAAEIHTIGSPPLLQAAVRALCAAGARLAEPGEFTLRAFLGGRLDLTQAEAVLGVIDAASRAELDVALAQLAGGLAAPLQHLRQRLIDLLAHLEAGLDFVEEEIEFITDDKLSRQLAEAIDQIQQITEQMDSRRQTAGQARVVFIGWPNVGKSSLLNALTGQPTALVAAAAGTTRDYVCQRTVLDGTDCLLIDTAGVATSSDGDIAAAAQRSTALQQQQAHLTLLCLDASRPLNDWEHQQCRDIDGAHRLIVLTKSDLLRKTDFTGPAIATSSRSGAGLDDLRRAVRRHVAASARVETGVVTGTAVRCHESLLATAKCLSAARTIVAQGLGEELVAAEIRFALEALGRVVGAVYTDDVLDRIFSRFCIGK